MTKRKDMVAARPRRRPYKPRERRKRVLLYCEGETTEPRYFRDFAHFLRSPLIEVEIADIRRKDARKFVELAKDKRDSANREAERAHDDNLRYDEVWCVFDRDDYAHFDEAIKRGLAYGLKLAVSNPCFELWLLLHFQDQYAFIDTRKAHRAVVGHVPGYVKHMDFAKLQGKLNTATERAKKMESRAQANGNAFDNPTTSVWRLTASLCEGSKVPLGSL